MYVDLILQNKGMKIGESVSKKFYNFTEKKSDFFRELKYHNLFIFVSISSSISSFCVLLACNRRQDILSTQILNNKSKSHQIIFKKLANRQLRSKQLINKTKGIQ